MPKFKVTRSGTYTQVVHVNAKDAGEARRKANVSEPVGTWHQEIGLDYEDMNFNSNQPRSWKVECTE